METPKRYRSWFIGLTLGVLAALFLWPATRWLMVQQLGVTLHTAPKVLAPPDHAAAQKVAARDPNDFALQLAETLTLPPATDENPDAIRDRPDSVRKRERLQALALRFPENPAVYANLMRIMAQGEVMTRRDEGDLLSGNPPQKPRPIPSPKWGTPAQLAIFDDAAAQGERLDPDNAYFPFMRSIGLYAAHRDDEAEEAIKRAATKSQWTEYYEIEVEGEWRLQQETFGNSSTILRIASSAAILFPHYAQLRNVARVAIYKAMQTELAGHAEDGLALRQAILECGAKMRVQSRTLIGSLVGIAISKIALARPGGEAALKSETAPANQSNAEWREQRLLQRYAAYLERIGHADALNAAQAEFEAGRQVREIGRHLPDDSPFDKPLRQLIVSWLWDLIVLSSALIMLLLGGAAALLSRHHRIKAGSPLAGYVQWGCACGLITAIVETIIGGGYGPEVCILTAILLGPAALFFANRTWKDRLRSLGVFALSLTGGLLILSAALWQMHSILDPQSGVGMLLNIINLSGSENSPEPGVFQIAYRIIGGSILIVPTLTLLTLSVVSLRCRVPLSVGLIRGLRGCALPIACLLLLGYAGLTISTLRQDQRVDSGLQRVIQHEGRYMAELEGKEWPGKTQK